MNAPNQIPGKLNRWRDRQNLTQEQAAKKLDVPVKTLRNWEQGRNAPRGLALRLLLKSIS